MRLTTPLSRLFPSLFLSFSLFLSRVSIFYCKCINNSTGYSNIRNPHNLFTLFKQSNQRSRHQCFVTLFFKNQNFLFFLVFVEIFFKLINKSVWWRKMIAMVVGINIFCRMNKPFMFGGVLDHPVQIQYIWFCIHGNSVDRLSVKAVWPRAEYIYICIYNIDSKFNTFDQIDVMVAITRPRTHSIPLYGRFTRMWGKSTFVRKQHFLRG